MCERAREKLKRTSLCLVEESESERARGSFSFSFVGVCVNERIHNGEKADVFNYSTVRTYVVGLTEKGGRAKKSMLIVCSLTSLVSLFSPSSVCLVRLCVG